MAPRSKDFVGLVPSTQNRPKSEFDSPYGGLNILRDNFNLTTWILAGALAQGALILLIGRLSLIPAMMIMALRVLDGVSQTAGLRRNTYLDGVIPTKTSVVIPDEEGRFGSTPSNQDIVVFHIGARFNHPLGVFSPKAVPVAKGFIDMVKNLEAHSDEFDFLSATSYQNLTAASKNELLVVCYFKNVEGLHRYAHSKYHLPLWQWFNKEVSELPHISIYHETYHVPKGNWENVHINSHVAGIGSTVFKASEEMTGKEIFLHPIVDASKGVLKTSSGRMARSKGDEHQNLVVDAYV